MQKINKQYLQSIITQILSNEQIENLSAYMTITQFNKLNAKKFLKVDQEMRNFFDKEMKFETDLGFEDFWAKFVENFKKIKSKKSKQIDEAQKIRIEKLIREFISSNFFFNY